MPIGTRPCADFIPLHANGAGKRVLAHLPCQPSPHWVQRDVPSVIPPVLVTSKTMVVEPTLPLPRQAALREPLAVDCLEEDHRRSGVGLLARAAEHHVEMIGHQAVNRDEAVGFPSRVQECLSYRICNFVFVENPPPLLNASREGRVHHSSIGLIGKLWQWHAAIVTCGEPCAGPRPANRGTRNLRLHLGSGCAPL